MVICYSTQETNTAALVIWSLLSLKDFRHTPGPGKLHLSSFWLEYSSPGYPNGLSSSFLKYHLPALSSTAIPSTPVLHFTSSHSTYLIHFVSLTNVFMICLPPLPWKHKLNGGRGLGLLHLPWVSSACISAYGMQSTQDIFKECTHAWENGGTRQRPRILTTV